MISILLPSRNRPRNIARFIDSFYQNSRGNIEFLFYIDDDDDVSIKELEYQKEEYKDLVRIDWLVGKRIPISNTYNLLLELAKGDIFCVTGDDVTSNSEGWDLIVNDVFDKYKDRLVLVGGCDLFNDSLFTTFFLSQEFINISGFLTPLGFFDYTDTWIFSVFSMINRIVKINCEFEHWHPSAGKCEVDLVMKEKNLRCYGGGAQSSHILYEAQKGMREELAAKLKEKINVQ